MVSLCRDMEIRKENVPFTWRYRGRALNKWLMQASRAHERMTRGISEAVNQADLSFSVQIGACFLNDSQAYVKSRKSWRNRSERDALERELRNSLFNFCENCFTTRDILKWGFKFKKKTSKVWNKISFMKKSIFKNKLGFDQLLNSLRWISATNIIFKI